MTIRRFVRTTLAVGILIFTWFALSAVATGAPYAAACIVTAFILLLALLVGLTRAFPARHDH